MAASPCFASILRDAREGALLRMRSVSLTTAKAGDPVFRGVSDGTEELRRTGYSAGACHRARRRRDPVAEYDDPCEATHRAISHPRIAERKRRHAPGVLARDQAADDRRLGALYGKSGGPEAEHAVGFLRRQTPFDQHVIDMGDQLAGG